MTLRQDDLGTFGADADVDKAVRKALDAARKMVESRQDDSRDLLASVEAAHLAIRVLMPGLDITDARTALNAAIFTILEEMANDGDEQQKEMCSDFADAVEDLPHLYMAVLTEMANGPKYFPSLQSAITLITREWVEDNAMAHSGDESFMEKLGRVIENFTDEDNSEDLRDMLQREFATGDSGVQVLDAVVRRYAVVAMDAFMNATRDWYGVVSNTMSAMLVRVLQKDELMQDAPPAFVWLAGRLIQLRDEIEQAAQELNRARGESGE